MVGCWSLQQRLIASDGSIDHRPLTAGVDAVSTVGCELQCRGGARADRLYRPGIETEVLEPSWVPTALVPSPILTDELTWARDDSRHLIRVATHVRRDAIFKDVFSKVAAAGGEAAP